jgi:hypothetical protein
MRFRLTCFLLMLSSAGAAAPLTDLSGGQIGRIEFNSSKPGSRFAVIRGNDGPAVVVWGDLMMPNSTNEKVPAVVFSHGSEGLHNL